MKMHFVAFVMIVLAISACTVSGNKKARKPLEPSPDKYDENYDKFLSEHFGGAGSKHLDKKAAYKLARQEAESGDYDDSAADDDEEEDEETSDDEESDEAPPRKTTPVDNDSDWYSEYRTDYDRIKSLSEKQVAELVKKPGNCKHYEKDGMVCATCADPETGDNSESCAYSSVPNDKKVAYLSKKSHNYKTPPQSEAEEPESHDDETEEQEELAVNPPPSGPKPLKHKTESEDADYGAYKLAGTNDDVEDYDAPKFAQIKVEPTDAKLASDFEIIPQSDFKPRNVNEAFSDFTTKDWSKCNKLMKGDMTCYYCKDKKGAVQEECMFISASNPKSYKVERSETKEYDSKKPSGTEKKPQTQRGKPFAAFSTHEAAKAALTEAIRAGPIKDEKKEKFARMRIGRPLMPTRASIKATAEPLVTPTTNINPNQHEDYFNSANKKSIKRMVSFKKKFSDTDFQLPSESRAVDFELRVKHTD